MKRISQITGAASVGILLTIFACVTINIYFPAEQVESVAGEIVDEIRGREQGDEKSSSDSVLNDLIDRIRMAFSPANAYAQDVKEVSNPTIRALKARMKARYEQLKPFYQKNLLNEGNNGYVSIKSTKGLGLKEKRDLNSLVGAENSDRKQLYAEIAKALKIDASQVNRIAEIFAKEWQKN
jgi:hypothetical protein